MLPRALTGVNEHCRGKEGGCGGGRETFKYLPGNNLQLNDSGGNCFGVFQFDIFPAIRWSSGRGIQKVSSSTLHLIC